MIFIVLRYKISNHFSINLSGQYYRDLTSVHTSNNPNHNGGFNSSHIKEKGFFGQLLMSYSIKKI